MTKKSVFTGVGTAILVLLFVVLTLYFYKKQALEQANKQTNNRSSFVEDKIKTPVKKPKVKAIKAETDRNQQGLEGSDKDSKESSEDQELDYVSAYRDWQYFANCFTDVEDFLNNKDPLQTLAERFEGNDREAQREPTPQQNSYYQQHVEICKSLSEDDDQDYYQIRQNLKQRYEKIAPTTEQAKQLQHAIRMVEQLDSLVLQYNQSQYKQSSLSDREISRLNREISQLTTAMMEIYDSSEQLSEEMTQTIKSYADEINKRQEKIANSRTSDEASVNEAQAIVYGYLNSIDDYLHRVQSPDAFLLLADKIYRVEYYKKDTPVIKNLKEATGIYDSYYLNILNTIVLPLVACSMNYPCDAESDFMLSYCLGLKDSMFNQACGLGLEDFYFSFYIGANQLSDVNNYFNYLVNRYAQ